MANMRDLTPRPLSPDRPVWEQQDDESTQAYTAFTEYRDMEKRSTRTIGSASGRWSVIWQWGLRCLEWDRHVARSDAEEMVRYRVRMNERQRAAARVAQAKVIEWLQSVDPKKLRPAEAVRWFEVAIRVEREAANVALPAGVDAVTDAVDDALAGLSFKDLLTMHDVKIGDIADLDDIEAAEQVYRSISKHPDG